MGAELGRVLITGGAGYIGSHSVVALSKIGYQVVLYDNLSNSSCVVLENLRLIVGQQMQFVRGDVRDTELLGSTIAAHSIDAVIHFAGLKAVGESVEKPLDYYDNNFIGTHRLLCAMQVCGVNQLVFSSSATVYGEPQLLPLSEGHPLSATNPYGRTKLMVEELLRDIYRARPDWRIAILRYFNPVGAHSSGMIGEDPQGTPNNLMPYIAQVAVGRREYLNIWGNAYPTADGTGVRDYIHVVDLALGHLKALEALERPRCFEVNLGTGVGYSVLDVVKAFEFASGQTIRCRISPPRPGDIASCYADPSLARQILSWKAERDLDTMCQDHWRWQKYNPKGFESA